MSALLANAIVSALLNVLVLAGLPWLGYALYGRLRHGRPFAESARRAGLQLGQRRYLGYSALFALAFSLPILALLPLEPLLRPGSPQRPFVGLGLSGTSIAMALLYGVVKTGFAEELLFRGLIAGSLARRLPLWSANLLQAAIFLLPHLLVLRHAPELWWLLPLVFASALFKGWVRIRSGSILGPWLIHAVANVGTCLYVAIRTVG